MKKLGFGLMRLPLSESGDSKDIDREAAKEMIDAYMAAGFNYFDTAYVYHRGSSEKMFGELVADRYERSSYVLTDKMPVWLIKEPADYDKIFEKQLARTHAGYFDYYFLHALGNQSMEDVEKFDGFGYLQKKKAEGLIRHAGFSFHGDAATLEKLLIAHPETELVQLQINYVDWESQSVESRKCYELCVKYGKTVSVMEPVKGGSLARVPEKVEELFRAEEPEKSPASWALRFAGSLENVLVVLSGMSSMEQLQENMEIFDHFSPLTEKEQDVIRKATEIFNGMAVIPCTACHYCTDGCPMNIAIPEYFSNYNTMKLYGYEPSMQNMYDSTSKLRGKASECVACGQCEEHCPQHLSIIENLKAVAEVFER